MSHATQSPVLVLPRDYQAQMISDARQALKRHRRVLVQAPTGAGKTVIAAFIIAGVMSRGLVAWFICHRQELVDGTSATLGRKFGIRHGIIAAGYPFNLAELVQVCSIDTLKARLAVLTPPRLAIIDEAHHSGAAGWAMVIAWLHAGGTLIIGLSATPLRNDGRGLDEHFDVLIPGPSVAWLMAHGHLARYQAYIPGGGMTVPKRTAGEFAPADIERAQDKAKLTGDTIAHWLKHADGLRTVGFAYSLEFSRHMVDRFNAAGIPAAHLDGGTPKDERRRTIEAFSTGGILVLWNRFLFGEGFDLAAIAQRDVTVDCVIDNAPTTSLALAMQRWGRCLRPGDVEEKIILDHAGNIRLHGFPEDEREWSLQGLGGGGANGFQGQPPVDCPQCFRQWRRPLPERCGCGHVFEAPPQEFKPMTVNGAELVAANDEVKANVRAARLREQQDAKSLDELVNIARKRGYTNPMVWASNVWGGRRYKRKAA
jgi:DNA repair protein RadD